MKGRARLAAIAAALLFSTGGAAIKVAVFTPAQVSAVRSGIAAVALAVYVRRLPWSPWLLPIGAVYAAALTLFVQATKLTTAANAIFLQSTFPLFILGLAPWLLRERINRRDVTAVAVIAVGIALCLGGQPAATRTAPDPFTGNLLGLASGLAWALTIVGLRHLERDDVAAGAGGSAAGLGLAAVVAGNTLACLGALPWALPFPHATAGEWATLGYLGLFQIAFAYVCLTFAMRRLPALEVSLLLLIEPALNPVWTWLTRGENPGAWVVAGGGVIIGATALKTLWDQNRVWRARG
jgi:drug/metabolite transporter (DMT)-like permease